MKSVGHRVELKSSSPRAMNGHRHRAVEGEQKEGGGADFESAARGLCRGNKSIYGEIGLLRKAGMMVGKDMDGWMGRGDSASSTKL